MNGFSHGMDRIHALFDAHPVIPLGLMVFVGALWLLKRKRGQQQDDPPPV
jgi:hypothetical protein